MILPGMSMATTTCVPYADVIYLLQAKGGASGTLTKSQTCIVNSGSYSINSQINVKKGFFPKQITQTASGTYASPNAITAKTFTMSENSQASLPAGDLDVLSLVLYLSSSLGANITKFPVIPLFYNDQTISVQCSVAEANATVTTSSGNSIPVTNVVCTTSGQSNAIRLTYSFSQDTTHQMLAASAVENGTTTMSAIINQ